MTTDVDTELQALATRSRKALAERWQQTFGSAAPTGCRSTLLRSALAWYVQASAAKPTGSSWEQLLRQQRAVASFAKAGAGTRLIREWQGRMHQVTVHRSGFEYETKTYRSLSAIAREITGTAWSGPAFFGLRK